MYEVVFIYIREVKTTEKIDTPEITALKQWRDRE